MTGRLVDQNTNPHIMARTKEVDFENYVEEMLGNVGWEKGEKKENWDVERGLFTKDICSFVERSQPELWERMRRVQGEGLEESFIEGLCKELEMKGALHVLRHGFKFYGKLFRLAFFKPAHALSPETLRLFNTNLLTVTRQVPCHPGRKDTVDLLFAVNGLPVATCELKNPWTGQTWENGIKQYRNDRDPNAPLFRFKNRTLVHFAADPVEIWMTTQLAREKTYFLPFNRGSNPGEIGCGKGNPPYPSGYPTGYFWEEVLERESFLDILAHFMFLEQNEEKVEVSPGEFRYVVRERMIFPRYHQLDAVRKLVSSARTEGSGTNYLIQHSAGSGKTNSISWLAHHLASLHDNEDRKVFDCVIVITDRRVLDNQLQNAVYQIEHAQGVVAAIDRDSRQLAKALIDGTKIVITTLQKFPWVLKGLLAATGSGDLKNPGSEEQEQAKEWEREIAGRQYALIVDEAHSSQTGDSAQELKQILGAGTELSERGERDDEEEDWEDRLNRVVESRGRQKNLSFFAFTATPKGKTIELFGHPGPDGKPHPFHLYSMRQAIEEGFILDVLQNYTTYTTYYKLLKIAEDDPDLPKKKATRVLAKFMSLHPHTIGQRTEVMVEHFREMVQKQLGGRAKAMVVTSSRLHAVRYKLAFDAYLEKRKYDTIRSLVAFSGKVVDPDTGLEYTEPGMNTDVITGKPISEGALPERFASSDYQILLVANKYQTGFDEPLLQAMYVDKRLDGVQAVQTLSRLNRKIPGKESPFVLDFVNKAEDIYRAFKPYYEKTELETPSDPAHLERLKHELTEAQIWHREEVERLASIFFKPPMEQQKSDHARMVEIVKVAADRFNALDREEEKELFYSKLKSYLSLYSFMSQIIPYGDEELEKVHAFGRMLFPYLHLDRDTSSVILDDDVALQYHRQMMTYSGAINIGEGEEVYVKSPTDVGTGTAEDEQAPLSSIIEVLNERFGTDFTEEERLFLQQLRETGIRNDDIRQTAEANPQFDKFRIGATKPLTDLIISRMEKNDELVTRILTDKEFGSVVLTRLLQDIFREIRGEFGGTG